MRSAPSFVVSGSRPPDGQGGSVLAAVFLVLGVLLLVLLILLAVLLLVGSGRVLVPVLLAHGVSPRF